MVYYIVRTEYGSYDVIWGGGMIANFDEDEILFFKGTDAYILDLKGLCYKEIYNLVLENVIEIARVRKGSDMF